MKVVNINGIHPNPCRCGSWLDHWQNFSKKRLPRYCAETTCMSAPTVGAPVQREDDGSWYIVPLCDEHNRKARDLNLLNGTSLVPANVDETCELFDHIPNRY